MFKTFLRAAAIAVAVLTANYPQTSFADGFTSADLLKWKKTSQDSYFSTSIGMAGVIASQNRREVARCIDEWYFADKSKQRDRNQFIRDTLRTYPDFDPQATILAIVQKVCGKLAESG